MDSGLAALGRQGIGFVSSLGGLCLLLVRFLGSLVSIPRSWKVIFVQLYSIGVRSLPLVILISKLLL